MPWTVHLSGWWSPLLFDSLHVYRWTHSQVLVYINLLLPAPKWQEFEALLLRNLGWKLSGHFMIALHQIHSRCVVIIIERKWLLRTGTGNIEFMQNPYNDYNMLTSIYIISHTEWHITNYITSSIQHPSVGMENPCYYTHTFQLTVDRQGTILVLSTLEMQSVKQPEYANLTNPQKQTISPKGPPCQSENLNESPNQASQDLFPSCKGRLIHMTIAQARVCIINCNDVDIKHVAMMQTNAWKLCKSNTY